MLQQFPIQASLLCPSGMCVKSYLQNCSIAGRIVTILGITISKPRNKIVCFSLRCVHYFVLAVVFAEPRFAMHKLKRSVTSQREPGKKKAREKSCRQSPSFQQNQTLSHRLIPTGKPVTARG